MVVKEMLKAGKTNEEIFEEARVASRNWIRKQEGISFSKPKRGDVPSIHVVKRTLPETWETTTMALMAFGQRVHTGYDPISKEGKFESFPSLEGSVMMHIEEPFGEPRFHQAFLGGYLGLGEYRAEVEGIHNHWMLDPKVVVGLMKKGRFKEVRDNTKWKYTYNQRLTDYPYIDIEGNPRTVNQIDSLLKKLVREPLSKSAQAVTWDARWDHNGGEMQERESWEELFKRIFTLGGGGFKRQKRDVQWEHYDSPCLQRLWFRLVPSYIDEKGDVLEYTLNLNTHWRSRDHIKAVPQNIYAVTEAFFEPTRQVLEDALRTPVKTGRYVDVNDSLHLYGHYFDIERQGLDAEAIMENIFKLSFGKARDERFVMPGTPMHDIYQEEIAKEYKNAQKNPNLGKE